ncbi:MAG TPA: DUF3105 domain-containing protein [Patescibacteria group bacterium]|nr:DUF3105 domain-containing protein [Patescibacteria group bacterium]
MKWILFLALILALGYWFFTRPMPGEGMADQGAEHVTDIAGFTYNSNPPTSGPHFEDWTRPGFYEQSLNDGNLIHSLEHGYIIVSFNCAAVTNCDQLKSDLKNFFDRHDQERLIIVARPQLDVPVALTAWRRLLKLKSWDETQAEAFFKTWHNLGPERTME